MTKNLEKADNLVKLVLSLSIIVSYFAGVIQGPFAFLLLTLALFILVVFITKLVVTMFLND
jgi:hypothetical protein